MNEYPIKALPLGCLGRRLRKGALALVTCWREDILRKDGERRVEASDVRVVAVIQGNPSDKDHRLSALAVAMLEAAAELPEDAPEQVTTELAVWAIVRRETRSTTLRILETREALR